MIGSKIFPSESSCIVSFNAVQRHIGDWSCDWLVPESFGYSCGEFQRTLTRHLQVSINLEQGSQPYVPNGKIADADLEIFIRGFLGGFPKFTSIKKNAFQEQGTTNQGTDDDECFGPRCQSEELLNSLVPALGCIFQNVAAIDLLQPRYCRLKQRAARSTFRPW